MDKNTIIGFVMIAAILIGYSIYSQPSEEEIAQQKELARLDSIQNAKNKNDAELKFKAEKEHSVEDNDSTGVFFAASKTSFLKTKSWH